MQLTLSFSFSFIRSLSLFLHHDQLIWFPCFVGFQFFWLPFCFDVTRCSKIYFRLDPQLRKVSTEILRNVLERGTDYPGEAAFKLFPSSFLSLVAISLGRCVFTSCPPFTTVSRVDALVFLHLVRMKHIHGYPVELGLFQSAESQIWTQIWTQSYYFLLF